MWRASALRSRPALFRIAGAALIIGVTAVAAGLYGMLPALGVAAVGTLLTAGVLVPRARARRVLQEVAASTPVWDPLQTEVRRSRRQGRPFVLIATTGDEYTVGRVWPLLRTPDYVWREESTVYILLTDCDRLQALGFINRLSSAAPDALDHQGMGVGAFPTDAVTVGALLQLVEPRRAHLSRVDTRPAAAI